jgi:XTP/dITP diphosphohydrolase
LTDSLLLATTNRGKLRELRDFLRDLPLEVHSLKDITPSGVYEETGRTFMENAVGKGLHYSRSWKGMTLGEDSGLIVDALGDDPGVYSARYAGPRASDSENIAKLLRILKDTPRHKRTARFVSAMALAREGDILTRIEESVEGLILFEKRGDGGFGYDPIFYFPPLKKTFAELSPAEKNAVSHRGKALRALKAFLSSRL